jgi:hypothetical protein
MNPKIRPVKKRQSSEERLRIAKSDLNKMMRQLQPYIRKSSYILNSTEGKWFDAATLTENVCSQSIGQLYSC